MTDFHKVYETLKNLPVAALAGGVVQSVIEGKVTILAAPTGSGKSMIVPAVLADKVQSQVVVLVPRRFLAKDAAGNVAALAGVTLGTLVGYAVGKMAGERSEFSDETKLLFVTYGYAISSGLVNTAKHIVLDEVHEAAEDISLARAILHTRRATDPGLQLLEMSATLNAQRQAGYWKDVSATQVHESAGANLLYEERAHHPQKDKRTIAQTAADLLTKEDRKGIAIFCPGVKDVERTVEDVQDQLRARGLLNVEVVGIHGDTPADEQHKARMEPLTGWRKVIVGTNVIESGVNLRWVDAGISDGTGKIPYDRPDTGAYALVHEHLPQWRIVQQRGRINRDPAYTGFDRGIFILHSEEKMEHRPRESRPELERRTLTPIAFKATALGYTPKSLKFDAQIESERWFEARDELIRLGLIEEDWSLTADGKFVQRLPLSPETGAMLCEAQRLDIAAKRSGKHDLINRRRLLPEAIILAALVEQEGLRANYTRTHGFEGRSDIHGGSDVLDSFKAYLQIEDTASAGIVAHTAQMLGSGDPRDLHLLQKAREELKAQCDMYNVNYTNFCKAMFLVGEIKARHSDPKAVAREPRRFVDSEFDEGRYNALKQVILQGKVNRLFQLEDEDGSPRYRDVMRAFSQRKNQQNAAFSGYEIGKFSALKDEQKSARTPLIVGNLREIARRLDGSGPQAATVIEQATSIPAEVFFAWAADHTPPLLDQLDLSVEKEFSARYAGRGRITLPLRKPTLDITAQIGRIKAAQA